MTRKGAELPGEVIFGSDDENLFLFAGGGLSAHRAIALPRAGYFLWIIFSGSFSLVHFV
jgi:hypothetical protein